MPDATRTRASVPAPVALAAALACLIVIVALSQAGGVADAVMRQLGRPHARFWFVHLPKAGGTAVVRLIQRGRCPDMGVEGDDHSVTASAALAAGHQPVLILRSPLSRLKSAFTYFKHGSELYRARAAGRASPQHPPQSRAASRAARHLDWVAFVDGLTNASSPARAAARAVTGAGRVLHFRPARHWADAKNGSTLYVCFSKRPGLLRRRLECAARAVGMRCGGLSELSTVNPSRAAAGEHGDDAAAGLSAAQRAALRELQRDEWELFDAHCGGCADSGDSGPGRGCCHSVLQ